MACWRRLAAESAPRLRGASEYELVAYAGALLAVVEQALIERVGDPAAGSACEPRGSLWCAAQALDASALLWHRLRPGAGRRFGALGASLQRHVRAARVPATTTSFAAATARSAGAALEQLASQTRPREVALEQFEGAAVALACMGVRIWSVPCRPRPDGAAANRALAVRRGTVDVAALAGGLVRSMTAEDDSSANWLASALALGMPADAGMIDDPDADRVLHAEALSTLRTAWVSRGALELLVIHALDREPMAPPRRLIAPYRIAAARAAARTRRLPVATVDAAWRKHSLVLARTLAPYMRARVANERWPGEVREELVDLLADSLVQVSSLDVLLGREPNGGSCAFGA